MKKIVYIILPLLALVSCRGFEDNPYEETLCCFTVEAAYPDGFLSREGVTVKIEDINLGNAYTSATDASGVAQFSVPTGLYRVNVSDRNGSDIFNGAADRVQLKSDMRLQISLKHSKAGTIVIKEIYCGGCKKLPEEGTYQSDQYVILHNNDVDVQYLDGLCFGTLHPYNATGSNPWISKDPATGETVYPDYLPIAQAVWQFPGSGSSFPLQSGEDAVICLRGAIDHSAQYPLSVNLNKEGYFVCYNSTYFTNTSYHPAPGNNIAADHILDVVIKTGQANAYTFSMNSPAAVVFRAKGMTMQEFVQKEGSIVQTPGDTHNPVTAIPVDWTVDAVEVFNGASATNTKRLSPSLDAGYVALSETYLGHTLMRKVDEELSLSSGFEVLVDTNNSSEDFYETEKQSLHE